MTLPVRREVDERIVDGRDAWRRAENAELPVWWSAGFVGRNERGCAELLRRNMLGRGRREHRRQVSSRERGDRERAQGQIAHDVVKISVVVNTLDPARIGGTRPCHWRQDDHQGHQKPDQPNETLHSRGYPSIPLLGSVNNHSTIVPSPWGLKELRARSCGATPAWRTENTGFGQHGILGGYPRATPAKVLLILSPGCILRLKMATGRTEAQ